MVHTWGIMQIVTTFLFDPTFGFAAEAWLTKGTNKIADIIHRRYIVYI